jgi:hypothetical protein
MSIVSWLLKSESDMAKKNTPCVKLGKYTLTSHAQNRVADPTRKTRKRDVIDNLFTRPHAITKTKTDSSGRPSYNRIGKRITTSINPRNNNVVSLRPVSDSEEKKYNLIRRNGRYVKKSKSVNRCPRKRKTR